jgi:hypothetical protein
LYGFNVDWFPRATPYDYDHPEDTWWDWENHMSRKEDFEELDNLVDLRDRTEDLLKHNFQKLYHRFDEHILSHYFLDVNEYMLDIWRDKR